ncbi:hypothetical protein [Pseudomonas synxantha]|uniref:hypothetical protein n=1 Tax=Pseudomonas synxantha TaxID=47883 RepID=UPI000F55C641|nr:hypothetical protein [Pseudomonas synxantha]AZE76246.1 hypothetical protein C4J99_0431 [Pseudomonas synxantha]
MSRIKLLNVVTPQGHAGDLSKGSQFSFSYSSAAEALVAHQARIDIELFSAMQAEWDGGRAMALHDSIGTGMKRKPIAKKPL